MSFLKSVLATIRKLDLSAIAQTAFSGLGWFGRIIGGVLAKLAEAILDKQIQKAEDGIEQKESDKVIEQKAEQNATRMEQAATDDDFDNAARDSLK
jgi:hypothetical protein